MSADIVNQASDWVARNDTILLQYIINLAAALLTLLVGYIAAKMISSTMVRVMEKRRVDTTITRFCGNMAHYAILTFVGIAALGRIGVQTASFVAIIGAAGLAIGLALQGSLSNFASGVLLILFRPLKTGEYVEAAGTAGTVESVQIFTTVLMTPDNKMVVIPNANILNGNIINYSRTGTRRVDLVIGVSYKADLAQTKAVLQSVLEKESRLLKDPTPTIGVSALADSSVNFVVRPWVKTEDYWDVYFDLHQNIKIALDEAGIEIPFPQMDVHLEKVAA
ncbi:small-conductance mechanosensitive channel MscS [Kistimonas asteriae]|uniref:small-conductance mechanosensitive channel MscS n=1 Tax=Kistimonas asteriae TaxID=517724 RepID=UPI001BAB9C6D|nr:small-conductance mechanosensitive channel MscS [Kistimonas asteriae]